jgi:3-phosphoshikimate 1-carboxyvinyltransferase
MDIPGDISSAAFLIVAACLLPGSDLVIRNVGLNPTRTGILDILRAMGANIEILDKWKTGGEPAGDLRIRATELKSTRIEGDLIIRAIDELPVLTVAAVFAEGETSIADAAELRVKEVDRITAMVNGLRELGGKLEETPNGIRIEGQGKLTGNAVSSLGDHRVGMALAVAGLAASGETHINQAEAIDDSFPGFSETLAHLGVVLA